MNCFSTLNSQNKVFYFSCKDKKKKKLKISKEVINNEKKNERLKK